MTAARAGVAARDVAGQGLFSVNWVPVPVPRPGRRTGTWAVAGPDPYLAAAGLAAAGVQVTTCPGVAALAAAINGGVPVPGLVALTAVGPAGEGPAGEGDDAGDDAGVLAEVLAGRVLTWVQEWLAGPAAGARLVVLTRDAVAAGAGDLVGGLAGSGVWGLVRSVQAENPGRVVLADLPRDSVGQTPRCSWRPGGRGRARCCWRRRPGPGSRKWRSGTVRCTGGGWPARRAPSRPRMAPGLDRKRWPVRRGRCW